MTMVKKNLIRTVIIINNYCSLHKHNTRKLEEFVMENFNIQPIQVNGNLEGNTIDYFCKFFLTNKFNGFTFIAHYGKGFDFHPIAGLCISHKIKPYTITNGNKI